MTLISLLNGLITTVMIFAILFLIILIVPMDIEIGNLNGKFYIKIESHKNR